MASLLMATYTQRQIKKYNRLTTTTQTSIPCLARTVMNLSDRQLTKEEIAVLGKGGNFAVAPKTLSVEDIITKIESVIRELETDVTEGIRREASRILQRARLINSNFTAREAMALRQLNNDSISFILQACKGNSIAILKTTNYEHKIHSLLNPSATRGYLKIPQIKFFERLTF